MLETLRGVDPTQVAGILSNLALRVGPTSSLETGPIQSDVLTEVRRRLRLDIDDWSDEARMQLADFLGREIRRTLLTKERAAAAKERLGAAGKLWSRGYRIEHDASSKVGRVRPANIDDAVRSPDAFQHLLPELFGFDGAEALSLFLKWSTPKASAERSLTLVLTNRRKDVQRVMAAWRVFPSEVNLESTREPLDVLKAFVDVFGTTIRIGNSDLRKFVLYEKVEVVAGSRTPLVTLPDGRKDHYVGLLIRRQATFVEVAVAYAVSLAKYHACLSHHGL